LFITYINDLPLRVNFVLELILFANVKISSRNFEDVGSVSNSVLSPMIKRFAANNLILNLDKTIMMKLITKNSAHSSIQFGHKEKYIEETTNKKFLGLQIDNHIKCENHVKEMIPKLSAACHAVRSIVHISIINTLKSIYYAYFHSITKCGIIFCGNSSNSGKIFSVQKKSQHYDWCTTQNLSQKSIQTTRDSACSLPVHTFIKILNSLPPSVTILKNDKAKFKAALRK
jgi:hypothetical protein